MPNCTLMLVDFTQRVQKADLSDKEKLQAIRGEVYSGLEDRLEELRKEALQMQSEMAEVVNGIDTKGFGVNLDTTKTGRWYRILSEVRVLQELASFMEGL